MAQTGIAASLGVTSVLMHFVCLPLACGSEEMRGQTGILAALAMPPTIGCGLRFAVHRTTTSMDIIFCTFESLAYVDNTWKF